MRPQDALARVIEHREIFHDEMLSLMRQIMSGEMSPTLIAAIIVGLRVKKETIGEIAAAAQVMREFSTKVPVADAHELVDTCGTGGDSSHSFNVSTAAAFVAAAAGVKIAKHGGRSVSSSSGSADVLEALGVTIPPDGTAAAATLAATGFTYLFAPHYHPATARVAPIRAALGVRTVFNILGPLVNPAQPPLHLIGAYSLEIARLMADTLAGLPIERAFVVHGAGGWDEPTPIGPFTLFDVRPGQVTAGVRSPADYGLAACAPAALAGGDASYNARALEAVLVGTDRGAHRDCLLLGTALALEVAGLEREPRAGLARAAAAIDGGAARRLLERLRSLKPAAGGRK